MSLSYLAVTDLRNITQAVLEPSPRLNIIVGPNGSGKTSILEAIYLLGRGKSFRSAYSRRIVTHGQSVLTVFGRTQDGAGHESNLGIQIKEGRFKAKVDGQHLKKSSDLAALLPLMFISPDADRLIKGSPRQRRRFLDWGLFHVEPEFLGVWQRYNRILLQRNSILRQGKRQALETWNAQFLLVAEELNRNRQNYVKELIPEAELCFSQLMGLVEIKFEYQQGWKKDEDLAAVLSNCQESDFKSGFSQRGPHRADLLLKVRGRSGAQYLSGGQLKLAACALMLAQAKLYAKRKQEPCICLVDDLAAELDVHHRQIFLGLLDAIEGQVFVTATDPALLDLSVHQDFKMFHVKQGLVTSK